MYTTIKRDLNGNIISISDTYLYAETLAQPTITRAISRHQDEGISFSIFSLLALGVLDYFFNLAGKLSTYGFPYNLVAKFYIFLFDQPFGLLKNLFIDIWEHCMNATQYNNLNLLLACISISTSGLMVLKFLSWGLKLTKPFSYFLVFGPGLICMIYSISDYTLNWLMTH